MIKALLAGVLAALLLGGGVALAKVASGASGAGGHDYPEAEAYAVTEDANADVDAALARAGESGKRVLLVMGANWCHDSRALAGWLGTERFKAMIEAEYELVFVNVGMPQSEDGHNLDIARRFGIRDFEGTPSVLVLTSGGQTVNLDTAKTWRNAASREEDAIYDELAMLADAGV